MWDPRAPMLFNCLLHLCTTHSPGGRSEEAIATIVKVFFLLLRLVFRRKSIALVSEKAARRLCTMCPGHRNIVYITILYLSISMSFHSRLHTLDCSPEDGKK
jgi:hypothetical protein